MKTLNELRNTHRLSPKECASNVSYMVNHMAFDFDVYLSSRGINLQREYVWSIDQKREIIWSILYNRHIPHLALIAVIDDTGKDYIYLVIDGKQRLSSIIDFIHGKYTIDIDGVEYRYSDLPDDYQRAISKHHLRYYIVHEDSVGTINDSDKIDWFKFLNFAGTPQDKLHMQNL